MRFNIFKAAGESIGEAVAKNVVEKTFPAIISATLNQAYTKFAASGAVTFARKAPLDKLEAEIMKYHDEYGEFDYSACAKGVKNLLIHNAEKLLNENPDWYQGAKP